MHIQNVPYQNNCIALASYVIRLDRLSFMTRDLSLLRALRDAVREAVRNLEDLKLVRADEDARIERMMREFREAPIDQEFHRETMSAD